MSNGRDKGIALITTLLILLLMSTMIVGLSWLVMGDQKLGGNNSDQTAFYGAESGLEALTAGLENEFNSNYAPTAADVSGIISAAPLNLVPAFNIYSPGSTTNGPGMSSLFPPTVAEIRNPATTRSPLRPTPVWSGSQRLTR